MTHDGERYLKTMFYSMRQQAQDAYTREGAGEALYNADKPLWLWLETGASDETARSFFDEVTQKYPAPLTGLVCNTDAAVRLADGLNRPYKQRALLAYCLNAHTPPAYAPGRLRVADADDAQTLKKWIALFFAEALGATAFDAAHQTAHESKAERNALYIWQHRGPCAMGLLCEPAGGMRRLNLIYTPTALRGRGYGKALVSALSRIARDEGTLPFMFTDASNKTAGGLYRSLGYKEAGRLVEVIFSDKIDRNEYKEALS